MTIRKTLVLLGGGGHAAVVADSARAAGFVVLGCLDDNGETDQTTVVAPLSGVTELKRLGTIADLKLVRSQQRDATYHAAVGDPALRRKWLDMLGPLLAPPIVHPTAVISSSVRIADGVFIGPSAIVNARATIGRGAIVNSGAIVEHDCVLEPFCHIAPGSVLAGSVTVGEASLIGAGAVVIPGVKIGSRSTLAAGAVAISDIPDDSTAIGVPAKVMATPAR